MRGNRREKLATALLDANSEMRLSIPQTRIIAERELLSVSRGEVKGRRFDGDDAVAGAFSDNPDRSTRFVHPSIPSNSAKAAE